MTNNLTNANGGLAKVPEIISIKTFRMFPGVPQIRCSKAFHKINRKKLVLKYLLDKITRPESATLFKKEDSGTNAFLCDF